jgi:hypothetical protein
MLLICYMQPNNSLQQITVSRHWVYASAACPVSTLIKGEALVWLFHSLETLSHQFTVCLGTFHQDNYHRIKADTILVIPTKNMGELLVHFHAQIKLWKSTRFTLHCRCLPNWANIQIVQNSCRSQPLPTKTYICKHKAMFSTGSSWKCNGWKLSIWHCTGNSWNNWKVRDWLSGLSKMKQEVWASPLGWRASSHSCSGVGGLDRSMLYHTLNYPPKKTKSTSLGCVASADKQKQQPHSRVAFSLLSQPPLIPYVLVIDFFCTL